MDALSTLLPYFSITDLLGGLLVLGIWFSMNTLVEGGLSRTPSTHILMTRYRNEWMETLLTREQRIADATTLANLQQSSRFFASGLMIAIGGIIALTDRTGLFASLASSFVTDRVPVARELAIVWDFKLLVTAIILASGFLKFMWANRLFGYCAIVMAAVPQDNSDIARQRARKAAQLQVTAARAFNRGLRTIYYALATLFWLVSGTAWVIALLVTGFVLYRREFHSASRAALLKDDA